MTDWSRLIEWIDNYFPEKKYSRDEVEQYCQENVPAWKYMDSETKDYILNDWENFIAEQVEEELEEVIQPIGDKSPSFWGRIKRFLGRLFGG